MISFTVTLNPAVIGATSALLLIFSWAFNQWITDHEAKHGYTFGNTAWLVVIGVLATLAGVALVSWQAATLVFIGFICSGPIMIWGEHNRELTRIRRIEQGRIDAQAKALLEKTDANPKA